MTESEAKERLIVHQEWGHREPTKEALNMAISALEEIQQYRAIGTVEELKTMKENGAFSALEMAQIAAKLNKLKEYEAIGTVEGFKYLKQSEHGYDNCHNYTCRMKCQKDGYAKAITEFAEAVKGKYPHFVEDVGFVEANKMLHCNIDEIAEQLKGE